MSKEDKIENEIVPDEEMSPGQDALKKIKAELKQCEAEKKEYLDGWQRAKADYINYKKDEAKRFEDMARFVSSGFIQDVLPILDSFDLALGHGLPPEVEKGILLIRSQFTDMLKRRGLVEIEVNVGEALDTERHESIGEVESERPPGTIAEVVQKGYLFQSRVLRPARVRLGKKKMPRDYEAV